MLGVVSMSRRGCVVVPAVRVSEIGNGRLRLGNSYDCHSWVCCATDSSRDPALLLGLDLDDFGCGCGFGFGFCLCSDLVSLRIDVV